MPTPKKPYLLTLVTRDGSVERYHYPDAKTTFEALQKKTALGTLDLNDGCGGYRSVPIVTGIIDGPDFERAVLFPLGEHACFCDEQPVEAPNA